MMTKLGSLALEREYLLSFSEQAGDLPVLSAGGTTIVGALTLHASFYLCLRASKARRGGSRLFQGQVHAGSPQGSFKFKVDGRARALWCAHPGQ
jgi:hypothetical protein